MSKIVEMMRDGLKPLMHTPLCKKHLASHSNCVGCISSPDCREWAVRSAVACDLMINGKVTYDWGSGDH